MAITHLITLIGAFCFLSPQISSVRANSTPPKNRKTEGAPQCELHAPEVFNPKDVSDEYLRELYSRCKPDATDAELREAYAYLHELQKEEAEVEKSTRALTGSRLNQTDDMDSTSRVYAVFSKHGKSYGTTDVRENQPFVAGEWYFKFNEQQDNGIIEGATFPNRKVLASGCARTCRWRLFFTCIGPYIESNIMVQSTDTLCYRFLFQTYCRPRDHRVYFRYWDTNPTSRGSCKCENECTRCTAD